MAVIDPQLKGILADAAELQKRLGTPAAVDLKNDRQPLTKGRPNDVEPARSFELPAAGLHLDFGSIAKMAA